MDELISPSHLVGGITLVCWLLWTFFSETRYNHGILVAFLLPLAPLIIPLVYIVYWLIMAAVFLFYALQGRRGEYEEAMRKIRVKSGFLMLL